MLRRGSLLAMRAVCQAMDKAAAAARVGGAQQQHPAPFEVMDAMFGRGVRGAGCGGPVDAMKLRASATLFALAAHAGADAEVAAACAHVLRHYRRRGRAVACGGQQVRMEHGTESLVGPHRRIIAAAGMPWPAELEGGAQSGHGNDAET